jgi:hypothetical protein
MKNAGTVSRIISAPLKDEESVIMNGILSIVVKVICIRSSTYLPSCMVISIADAFKY